MIGREGRDTPREEGEKERERKMDKKKKRNST
jgi:hypothetical protein